MSATTHFHGAQGTYEAHAGLCLTDDVATAINYADGGEVALLNVELRGVLTELESYDSDSNEAPGDDGNAHGSDVLIYADSDPHGHSHTTWRLMTPEALAGVTLVGRLPAEWASTLHSRGVAMEQWVQIVTDWMTAGGEASDYEWYDGDIADFTENN